MDIPKNVLISGVLFFGTFFFSLGSFIVERYSTERRLLFFPEHIQRTITGEVRPVVKRDSVEENVEILLHELVLGPMDIKHSRLVSQEARIKSVLIREGIAYVDFSYDILQTGEDVKIGYDEGLSAIKRAILYNFRGLKDVVFTIEGQIPGEPVFIFKEDKKKATGEKAGKKR